MKITSNLNGKIFKVFFLDAPFLVTFREFTTIASSTSILCCDFQKKGRMAAGWGRANTASIIKDPYLTPSSSSFQWIGVVFLPPPLNSVLRMTGGKWRSSGPLLLCVAVICSFTVAITPLVFQHCRRIERSMYVRRAPHSSIFLESAVRSG